MSYLLHIDSSSLGESSVSRQVAQSFRQAWPGQVVHRDLAAAPVPHLEAAGITARTVKPARHTPEQAKATKVQDELIEEFLGADSYLFTVPMYNLTMPSVFKAWLDQIVVDGRTFDHAGPSPAAGRPAVLISARGGGYGPGAPYHGFDYVVPTMEAVLGRDELLGLDVTTVIPELTMAPHTPALAELLPKHEASMAAATTRPDNSPPLSPRSRWCTHVPWLPRECRLSTVYRVRLPRSSCFFTACCACLAYRGAGLRVPAGERTRSYSD